MKFQFLFLATLVSFTLISGCKTSYTEEDMYYPTYRMTDYQATSQSVYPTPQAYNISNPGGGFARVKRPATSNLEVPYEDGHNAVRSSFGANMKPKTTTTTTVTTTTDTDTAGS